MRRDQRGQVTVETAVLYTCVIAGLVYMGVYLQRGVQGSVRGNADGIGSQLSTESKWNSFSAQDTHETLGLPTKTGSCSQMLHNLDAAGSVAAAGCIAQDAAAAGFAAKKAP